MVFIVVEYVSEDVVSVIEKNIIYSFKLTCSICLSLHLY